MLFSFFFYYWKLNSGPLTCKAGACDTELYPWPSFLILEVLQCLKELGIHQVKSTISTLSVIWHHISLTSFIAKTHSRCHLDDPLFASVTSPLSHGMLVCSTFSKSTKMGTKLSFKFSRAVVCTCVCFIYSIVYSQNLI